MHWLELSCDLILLIVVHDFHFKGVTPPPLKANAPLVVHTNAVSAGPIPLHWLQPVPGEHRRRLEVWRSVKQVELAKSRTLDGLEPAHRLAAEQALRVP